MLKWNWDLHHRYLYQREYANRWLGIKCVVGTILMLVSSYAFSKRVWTESIYLIIMFLVGCYMIISAGGAWILKSYRKKGNGYYKRLPFLQQFYSRFKTHRSNFLWYTFFIFY